MPWNVGEKTGTDVGGIMDVCGGDESGGGGGTPVVSIVDIKLLSPILTFKSMLDIFFGMFEFLPSSIL